MFHGNPSFRYIPRCERPDDSRELLVELTEPMGYDFWLDVVGGRMHLRGEVPKGFKTDFASVPRFFWRIFPPLDDWWRAAILHDYLLERSALRKKTCDRAFLMGLRADRVPKWRRACMYAVVRLFGGRTRRE